MSFAFLVNRTSRPRRRSAPVLFVSALCIGLTAAGVSRAKETAADQHVATAERLVEQLDLANTGYAHGPGSVTWTGTVVSYSDCSCFINDLLAHDDGLAPDDFRRWMGHGRPSAENYHDAIVATRGFARLDAVMDVRPGDLIATRYLTRHDNTGHIMLVAKAPRRIAPSPPFVGEDTQWSIAVIDSSKSGHGPADTRHKRGIDGHDHPGLSRGVLRIYADARGEVAGFSWSTAKNSRFIGPEDEHLVIGRLVADW